MGSTSPHSCVSQTNPVEFLLEPPTSPRPLSTPVSFSQVLSVQLAKLTSSIKFECHKSVSQPAPLEAIKVTQTIVSLFEHSQLASQSLYWYHYLIHYIDTLRSRKSLVFVTKDQWRMCLGLAEFVMLLGDDVYRKMGNNPNTPTIQSMVSKQDRVHAYRSMQELTYYCIYLRNKQIRNVSTPYTLIYRIIQCLVVLLVKLHLHIQQSSSQTAQQQTTTIQSQFSLSNSSAFENTPLFMDPVVLKRNFVISTYAIGLGIQFGGVPGFGGLAVTMLTGVLGGVLSNQIAVGVLRALPPVPVKYFHILQYPNCRNLPESAITLLLHAMSTNLTQIDIPLFCSVFEQLLTLHVPTNKEIPMLLGTLSQGQGEVNEKEHNRIKAMASKYWEAWGQLEEAGHVEIQMGKIEKMEGSSVAKELEVGSEFSESYATQGYKTKYLQLFKATQIYPSMPPVRSRPSSPSSCSIGSQISTLYHKIVTRRFLPEIPGINAEETGKEEEEEKDRQKKEDEKDREKEDEKDREKQENKQKMKSGEKQKQKYKYKQRDGDKEEQRLQMMVKMENKYKLKSLAQTQLKFQDIQ